MAGNSIATAYVQVRPSMDGVADEVRRRFEDTGDKSGGSFGSSFAKRAMTAVSAAAIGKALTASLLAGGDLQQSLGGVETLFKDSAAKVIANAERAYSTAGMSANAYMQQVTGFSASLLQSLGGDTVKAADMADTAMQDMADNANKFGTDMQSITYAYQGFAKQNYTMLDNLKLGYGGTKAEMERLLETANQLNAQQGIYTEYQISSFADVVSAIHVVQTEMGVTGTTAAEAAETFTGSLNAMKAAAENVAANLALGREIQPALDALADTVVTFVGGNLIPMVVSILSALPGAVLGIFRSMSDQIASELEAKIPGLGKIFKSLETAILAAAAAFAAFKAGAAIMTIVQGFQKAQVAVALYTMEMGTASIAQGIFNGALSVGEAIAAVFAGKVTIAQVATAGLTAAQGALNKVMSANPIGLVIAAVAALGVAIYSSKKKLDEMAESLMVQTDSSAEAADNLAKLKVQAEMLEETKGTWSEEQYNKYQALTKAIAETEQQILELQQTEAEQAAVAAAIAAQPVQVFNAATEQYIADATALYETFVETYEATFEKVAGWFGPFETASTSVQTSIEEMMAAMQSQMEFNEAYSANLAALKEYGLGELSAAFQQGGKDGAAYAAAIVAAVEQAGGASSAGGQEIIRGFQEMNQGVTESQAELAATMTMMDGEFEAAMGGITSAYGEAIEGLDKSAEAKKAAINTFQNFKQGIDSQTPGIMAAMSGLGSQMTASLQAGIGTVRIPVETIEVKTNGSHAGGLDYVPFDNYIAALHRGEMVLTSYEAEMYRKNGGGKASVMPVNVTQNIYSQKQSAADLMLEARYQAEMGVLMRV